MHCNIAPLPGKSQQLGAADKKGEEGDLKKRVQVQKVSLSEEKQEQKNSQKQPL